MEFSIIPKSRALIILSIQIKYIIIKFIMIIKFQIKLVVLVLIYMYYIVLK